MNMVFAAAVVFVVASGSNASAKELPAGDVIWKGRRPAICLMGDNCDREQVTDIVICEMHDPYERCRHRKIHVRLAERHSPPSWPIRRLGPV